VLQTTEALILANPAIDDPAFQRIAEALQQQLPAVAEIQLSPDGVIQFVYPPERAAKVRGLNLLTLPGQKDLIEQTIREGRMRVAGPLRLYQGGTGIIARNPVYLGTGSERRFWGFVTLVLDYEKFIAPFPEIFHDPELVFAVRGKDGLGAAGTLFIGDAATFSEQAITATVNLPNGGAISNLPAGAIVEVPGLLTGAGVLGLGVGKLPPAIAELCRREITVSQLCVDAAVHGDRDAALQCLLLDPVITDLDTAKAILDDYLQSYRQHLPAFWT
jgi:hypothetical protein